MPKFDQCMYKNCNNRKRTSSGITFFKFPINDAAKCKAWIINSGNNVDIDINLGTRVLCEEHFHKRFIIKSRYKRLVDSAVPRNYKGVEQKTIEATTSTVELPAEFCSEFLCNDGLATAAASSPVGAASASRVVPLTQPLGNAKLAELSAEQLNRQKAPCSDHSRDGDCANQLRREKEFATPGQSGDGDDSRLSPVEFNVRIPVRTYESVFRQAPAPVTASPAEPETSSLRSVSLRHMKRYKRKVVTLKSEICKKDGLLRRHHKTILLLREELNKFSKFYTTVIWQTRDRDLALRIYFKSSRIYRFLKDVFVIMDLTGKTKSVSN